jgi:hypothetical protein
MKIVTRVCVVVLSVLIVALIVFYGLWVRCTSSPRILVERDVSDIATLRGSPVQAGYDPYFNRVNFTRDVMRPTTNYGSPHTKPH